MKRTKMKTMEADWDQGGVGASLRPSWTSSRSPTRWTVPGVVLVGTRATSFSSVGVWLLDCGDRWQC